MKPLVFHAAFLAFVSLVLSPLAAHASPSPSDSVHFCLPFDFDQWRRDHPRPAGKRLALNVGEPRVVRMIYLLPNDRPFRQAVVDKMKATIRRVQSFYAEQMQAHGYGNRTFRFETDAQGEPLVHRVDGSRPDRFYRSGAVLGDELGQAFDLDKNIYLTVSDVSTNSLGGALGIGARYRKNSGSASVAGSVIFEVVAHELGHAFGLEHDFRDDAYIMSYGDDQRRSLSACSAEFLAVHPYFNPEIPLEEGQPPTIKLISPRTYPAGSESISIQLKVADLEGLHQVILMAGEGNYTAVKACRGLSGESDAVVEFEYDGDIPSAYGSNSVSSLSDPVVHRIFVNAVDSEGNLAETDFMLTEISPHQIATLEIATLEGYDSETVTSVAFSSDGATLASARSWDGTVTLWDVRNQERIATLESHTDGVWSVSFSPDSAVLASGSWDGTVTLWDVATQKQVATLEGHITRTEGGSVSYPVRSVLFSPNGTLLASIGGDTIILWDVATQKQVATLKGYVYGASFSPDGTLLAFETGGAIILWDVATQKQVATFEGYANTVSFSPDGTLLASGTDDTVILWDVATQKQIATLKGHTNDVRSVSFSALDGVPLASGGRDGRVILWDVLTKEKIVAFGFPDEVTSLSLSPGGSTLAAGGTDGTVILWGTSEWTRSSVQAIPVDEDQQESEEKLRSTVELKGISSSHDSVRENDSQATTITLTVTLGKAAAADETITLAIVAPQKGKTAFRDVDFDATLEGTITIPKGQTKGTAQLTVTPKDNTTTDGHTFFGVQATSSSGHQALIDIKIADNEMDDGEDNGDMVFGFAGEVEDQAYTAGTAISALELPEATGGEGGATYRVFGLPAGLLFDAATRTISGTPEAATDGDIEVIYTAQDSAGASVTLTFSITVNPPLSFGDFFDLLFNGGEEDAGGG